MDSSVESCTRLMSLTSTIATESFKDLILCINDGMTFKEFNSQCVNMLSIVASVDKTTHLNRSHASYSMSLEENLLGVLSADIGKRLQSMSLILPKYRVYNTRVFAPIESEWRCTVEKTFRVIGILVMCFGGHTTSESLAHMFDDYDDFKRYVNIKQYILVNHSHDMLFMPSSWYDTAMVHPYLSSGYADCFRITLISSVDTQFQDKYKTYINTFFINLDFDMSAVGKELFDQCINDMMDVAVLYNSTVKRNVHSMKLDRLWSDVDVFDKLLSLEFYEEYIPYWRRTSSHFFNVAPYIKLPPHFKLANTIRTLYIKA